MSLTEFLEALAALPEDYCLRHERKLGRLWWRVEQDGDYSFDPPGDVTATYTDARDAVAEAALYAAALKAWWDAGRKTPLAPPDYAPQFGDRL